MWKYIVTCWIVTATPVLKESKTTYVIDGVITPKKIMYFELITDTLCVIDTFSIRKEAVDYIETRENSTFFYEAYNTNGRKTWFKLDSVKLKSPGSY